VHGAQVLTYKTHLERPRCRRRNGLHWDHHGAERNEADREDRERRDVRAFVDPEQIVCSCVDYRPTAGQRRKGVGVAVNKRAGLARVGVVRRFERGNVDSRFPASARVALHEPPMKTSRSRKGVPHRRVVSQPDRDLEVAVPVRADVTRTERFAPHS
jgi:hypothetical protein